jgi:hypothetical protein
LCINGGSSQPNRVRVRGGQDFEAILADRRVQRRAERLPVGQKLVQRDRIDDRTGKDVRADRRAFSSTQTLTSRACSPASCFRRIAADRPGGAGADDHHIGVRIALHTAPGRFADGCPTFRCTT